MPALISNYGLGDLASQTQRIGNLSYSLLSRHFQHVGVANGTSITMGIGVFWSILKSQKHIEKSVSLVFAWLVFTFLDSQNFLPINLRLGFLTMISLTWESQFYHMPPLHVAFSLTLCFLSTRLFLNSQILTI